MLYKKLVVIWATSEEAVTSAANLAVETARRSSDRGEVSAFGIGEDDKDDYSVPHPENDPHYIASVEEDLGEF